MNERISLRRAEQRAVSLTFSDGFWDILWGFSVLGTGLRALTDNLWYYLLIVVGVAIALAGKWLVTLPRIGRVRLGPKRIRRHRAMAIVIVLLLIATFAALLLATRGTLPGASTIGLVLAALVPIVLVAIAYLLGFSRLYAYAAMTAIYMALTELYWDTNRALGAASQVAAGAVILLIGLIVLARFLQRYPRTQAPSGLGVSHGRR